VQLYYHSVPLELLKQNAILGSGNQPVKRRISIKMHMK